MPTALETLISGYFHQDWDILGPDLNGVLDAYVAEVTREEREEACAVLDSVLASPGNAAQVLGWAFRL
jgi:hypothetical protein